MSVTIVVSRVIQLCTPTYIDGFRIQLVHIVHECQIIVRIRVQWIKLSALFEMIDSLVISFYFEVSKSKIVL